MVGAVERVQPDVAEKLRELEPGSVYFDRGSATSRFFAVRYELPEVMEPPQEAAIELQLAGLNLISEMSPLIHSLVVGHLAYAFGGSTGKYGSISSRRSLSTTWIDPDPEWTPWDLAETLIHEATHTILLLDEMRFSHYKNSAEDVFCTTAILGVSRPYPTVFHSAVVANEILMWRRLVGSDGAASAHGSTATLEGRLGRSLDELRSCANQVQAPSERLTLLLSRSFATDGVSS